MTQTKIPDTPPPVLDMARVIAYAIVDKSVQWTGRQLLFVDWKELGAVPHLALCQNVSGELKDILVFHCNEEWEVLGCSGGGTIEEAKASIECAYRGITAKWIETNVTEDEAKAWIKANCPDIVCSFCDREMGEFKEMIVNKSGLTRVCNICIDEHYKVMHERDSNMEASLGEDLDTGPV
jgi:hypothetical protein